MPYKKEVILGISPRIYVPQGLERTWHTMCTLCTVKGARDMDTTKITIGQEVVLSYSHAWSWRNVHYVLGYRITRITTSGQVVVERAATETLPASKMRFNADGREITSNLYKHALHFNVEEIRAKLAAERAAAVKAIEAVRVSCEPTSSIKDMRDKLSDLESLLNTAKRAVDNVSA